LERKLFLGEFLAVEAFFLLNFVLQASNLIAQVAVLGLLAIYLLLHDAVSVVLQRGRFVGPLSLELCLSKLCLQVANLLAGLAKLFILQIDPVPQLSQLLFELFPLSLLAVLEVFDNVEFVFLEHVVVRVKLFVLFLETGALGLSFLPQAVVQVELLINVLYL